MWDIEPDVQVAGITDSESLVLDGCRAATIRWKNFPKVRSTMKAGFKRVMAMFLAGIGTFLFMIGIKALGGGWTEQQLTAQTSAHSHRYTAKK